MQKMMLLLLITSALSANALAADFTEERVKELVGEYLKENPEAIIESLQAYQLKEEMARAEKQQSAVKETLPAFTAKDSHYGEAGNPKGDVTLVEFFDYNCPACKMMFNSIDALLLSDKNTRVIFVEMPIFGPTSDENAKISMAVNALKPEAYYRFHSAAMSRKGKTNAEQLLAIAENLGIDKDKLKEEAAKPKYDALIAKDRELANQLQISGTPAMIIGDQFFGGAMGSEKLKAQVKEAREKK